MSAEHNTEINYLPVLGVLFSGSGTTAQEVFKALGPGGRLEGKLLPAVAVASRPDAKGIELLRALNVPVEIADYKELAPRRKWGARVAEIYRDNHVDISAQLGLIPRVPKRVLDAVDLSINQHPARLDRQFIGCKNGEADRKDFGGKGMRGSAAVAATLIYMILTHQNEYLTGTVHHANGELDGGLVIKEVNISIDPYDRLADLGEAWRSADELQVIERQADKFQALTKRYQKELLTFEHANVVQVLSDLAAGERGEVRRNRPLVPRQYWPELDMARTLAVRLFPDG